MLQQKEQQKSGGLRRNSSVGINETRIAGLYDLEHTIGKGHFAVVKLARHVFTGEKVAVKVIDKTKLDKESAADLMQEVRCMKLVQHPNIVRLYEVIDTQTKLFLILELGDYDMHDYIMRVSERGGCKESEAQQYFSQIIKGDRLLPHAARRFSNLYTPGQQLSTSCGSLAYSAPEILLGDAYDAPAVDIWSLGVILYMLVCGRLPFQEANESETLTRILDCRYSIPDGISAACKELIQKMLVRDPTKRATLDFITKSPAIDQGEYSYLTATYYLLAERVLAAQRVEQATRLRDTTNTTAFPEEEEQAASGSHQPTNEESEEELSTYLRSSSRQSSRFFTKRDNVASRAASLESFRSGGGPPILEAADSLDADSVEGADERRAAGKKLSIIQADDDEEDEENRPLVDEEAPSSHGSPKVTSGGLGFTNSFAFDELSPIRELMEANFGGTNASESSPGTDREAVEGPPEEPLDDELPPTRPRATLSWQRAVSSSDEDERRGLVRRRRFNSSRSVFKDPLEELLPVRRDVRPHRPAVVVRSDQPAASERTPAVLPAVRQAGGESRKPHFEQEPQPALLERPRLAVRLVDLDGSA
ncbi:Kinase domain protein [Aphelenchoides fujianensis]|nr:Kinase domain protein [Aphelenchoides fujianensis]